jgi:hypothetical protein
MLLMTMRSCPAAQGIRSNTTFLPICAGKVRCKAAEEGDVIFHMRQNHTLSGREALMKRVLSTGLVVASMLGTLGSEAQAGITLSPYVSIRSTKSVNPNKKNGTETEKIRQHQEMGVMAGVSFWRLFRTSLSVGQSKMTSTETTQAAVDEYDQIDYKKDLNMSTDDPTKEVKLTETQNVARFSLMVDPSFWIFIMRAKVGVTATQRIIEKEELGAQTSKVTKGPFYKPHSGVGAGIRLTPSMYFMAEYSAYHYKFPEVEPFERQLSVSYSVAL